MGPSRALPEEKGSQRLEHAGAALPRVHGRDRGVSWVYRGDVLQVRGSVPGWLLPPGDEIIHPPGDLGIAVLFLYTEDVLQEIQDRQVGNVGAVRDAVAFDPSQVLATQPAAQLEEQPGLPDARLTRDEHHLPGPLAGPLQVPLEHRQLLTPADEPGQ